LEGPPGFGLATRCQGVAVPVLDQSLPHAIRCVTDGPDAGTRKGVDSGQGVLYGPGLGLATVCQAWLFQCSIRASDDLPCAAIPALNQGTGVPRLCPSWRYSFVEVVSGGAEPVLRIDDVRGRQITYA